VVPLQFINFIILLLLVIVFNFLKQNSTVICTKLDHLFFYLENNFVKIFTEHNLKNKLFILCTL